LETWKGGADSEEQEKYKHKEMLTGQKNVERR
jgi:hypothetical protein